MAVTVCAATVSLHAANARITSEGDYPPHLQGVCTDGTNIWWSHTVELTRTDLKGKVLTHAKGLKSHHGDLCVVGGTVYVAVNHGKFNTEDKADSWVYAYRGDDLSFIKRWKVPELCHGAGGMTWKDGHFFIIGGLPPTHNENYVYEYTPEFTFIKRHVLNSDWTREVSETMRVISEPILSRSMFSNDRSWILLNSAERMFAPKPMLAMAENRAAK